MGLRGILPRVWQREDERSVDCELPEEQKRSGLQHSDPTISSGGLQLPRHLVCFARLLIIDRKDCDLCEFVVCLNTASAWLLKRLNEDDSVGIYVGNSGSPGRIWRDNHELAQRPTRSGPLSGVWGLVGVPDSSHSERTLCPRESLVERSLPNLGCLHS